MDQMASNGEASTEVNNAAPAPTLSAGQKKRALRKKKQKSNVKNVLCTPTVIGWPPVNEQDENAIHMLLKSSLATYDLRPSGLVLNHQKAEPGETPWSKLGKEERQLALAQFEEKRKWEEKNLRGQVVIGMNRVIKELQTDNLQVVIVSRGSWELTKNLAQLTATKACPALAISTLKPAMGFLGCTDNSSALGFKKLTPNDCKHFCPVLEFVVSKCRPLDVPWAPVENVLSQGAQQGAQQGAPQSAQGDTRKGPPAQNAARQAAQPTSNAQTAAANKGQNSQPPPKKDYSHLYVFKTPRPPQGAAGTQNGLTSQQSSSEQREGGLGQKDFVSFSDDHTMGEPFPEAGGAIAQQTTGEPTGNNRKKQRRRKRKLSAMSQQPDATASSGSQNNGGGAVAGAGAGAGVGAGAGGASQWQTPPTSALPQAGYHPDRAPQGAPSQKSARWDDNQGAEAGGQEGEGQLSAGQRKRRRRKQKKQNSLQPAVIGQMEANPERQIQDDDFIGLL